MMTPRILPVTAALIATLAFSAMASAQLVPRAENGRVELLAYPPQGLESPRVVNRGETVWVEPVRPRYAVRPAPAWRAGTRGKPVVWIEGDRWVCLLPTD